LSAAASEFTACPPASPTLSSAGEALQRRINGWSATRDGETGCAALRALPPPSAHDKGQFCMDLALFDFDGTITTHDTFRPFLSFASSRARMALGTALLGPMVVGYEIGWIRASRMRAAAAYLCCRGRPERELRELGARYGQTLTRLFRPEALERIRWHKRRGDTVVVVSASLRPYLEDLCRGLEAELVCTELEARRSVLTGHYLGGDCTGPEKARRVRVGYDLARYSTIFAYGDTREDAELLELATRRYYRWRELPAGGGVPRERLSSRPTR
jgi:phosphatidylglycerophosphatase C